MTKVLFRPEKRHNPVQIIGNQSNKGKNPVQESSHCSYYSITRPPSGVKTLKNRAKNKYFSQELTRSLIVVDSPLNKAYRRTHYDCSSTLLQEGYKVTSKYCNGRWCNVCNRIRTAKLINGYRTALEAFLEPHFITLTIPNVKAESLEKAIKSMRNDIQLITKARRRVTQFNGVRKIECTYNSEDDTYHPHLHLIIDGKKNAEWLWSEWLKRHPDAHYKGQDYRKADEGSLMELFKYTTKIVTKTKNDGFCIYVTALDTIFQAMYKVRTFQSFGNVRMVSEDIEDIQSEDYDIPYYEGILLWDGCNFFRMGDGERVSDYKPSRHLENILNQKVII